MKKEPCTSIINFKCSLKQRKKNRISYLTFYLSVHTLWYIQYVCRERMRKKEKRKKNMKSNKSFVLIIISNAEMPRFLEFT